MLAEFKRGIDAAHKKAVDVANVIKDMTYEDIQDYILKNPRNVNTFTKSKVLREMLRHIDGLKDHGTILSEGINSGDKCIVDIRNAYGHQIAKELQEKHSPNLCKMIRTETRRQVNNIKEVAGK